MIRLNFALHRQSHLSREDFQHYWREKHGPLVASVGRALRVRRYVQSHTVDDPLYDGLREGRTGMQEPHDGIASLWWDTREDLVGGLEGHHYREDPMQVLVAEELLAEMGGDVALAHALGLAGDAQALARTLHRFQGLLFVFPQGLCAHGCDNSLAV